MSHPSFGGPWTQEKLEILRRYLDAYTTVLKRQPFRLTYVDAFAGTGSYSSADDDYRDFYSLKAGSARIALEVDSKPFDRLVFIEKDSKKIESLNSLKCEYPGRDVTIIEGDANIEVPRLCGDMEQSERAVIFLDPFATEVSWSTVEGIALTRKTDCWILFPLMAVNRMMQRKGVPREHLAKHLDRIFGDCKHWQGSYKESPQLSMLDDERQMIRMPDSQQIAALYGKRLASAFHSVASTSRTLYNLQKRPLFELFFAASNPAGAKPAIRIADHILMNW